MFFDFLVKKTSGILFFGQKKNNNNIPEVFLTKKAKNKIYIDRITEDGVRMPYLLTFFFIFFFFTYNLSRCGQGWCRTH